MSKYLHILLFLFLSIHTTAQSIEAEYRITQTLTVTLSSAKSVSIPLTYTGHLFKQDQKHIYFQRPLYLSKYPTGEYVEQDGENYYSIPLVTDTIQKIMYNNTDSLIFRTRADFSGTSMAHEYFVFSFELGAHEWKLTEDKKVINGLNCQRILQYRIDKPDELFWDAWVCVDIPINFGPSSIRDVPGLVVEATNIPYSETYVLESYKMNQSIPASIFWPDDFNSASFVKRATIKRRGPNNEPSRSQKKADIINQ